MPVRAPQSGSAKAGACSRRPCERLARRGARFTPARELHPQPRPGDGRRRRDPACSRAARGSRTIRRRARIRSPLRRSFLSKCPSSHSNERARLVVMAAEFRTRRLDRTGNVVIARSNAWSTKPARSTSTGVSSDALAKCAGRRLQRVARPGWEDGRFKACLEWMHLPYTGSGVCGCGSRWTST